MGTLRRALPMLRTTANALWSRFVPAARQHITGATVASASRRSFFSSPTAREEDDYEIDEHAPPLNLFGLPARYASALYTAASRRATSPRCRRNSRRSSTPRT